MLPTYGTANIFPLWHLAARDMEDPDADLK